MRRAVLAREVRWLLGFGVATSTSLAALITGIWHIVLISVVQGLGVYTPAEPVTTYEERSCLQR